MKNYLFTAWGAGQLPHLAGRGCLFRSIVRLLVLSGFALMTACGPAPRSSQSLPAAQPTVAALPPPKTLESTLQLGPDVEEISLYPQGAESAHGDTIAVGEQFDGAHHSIWGSSRRAHQDWGRAQLMQTSDSGHSNNPRVAVNAQGYTYTPRG